MKLSKKTKRVLLWSGLGAVAYVALGAVVTYQETGEAKALLQLQNIGLWPYLYATNGDWALDSGASISGSYAKLFTGATG